LGGHDPEEQIVRFARWIDAVDVRNKFAFGLDWISEA
jgi:hypothetical protein